MLHQVTRFNPQIVENVIWVFEEIHARGVCHGDVRAENILVRGDNSVVVVIGF
jgi:RIO-like serine/threonine protein kinase